MTDTIRCGVPSCRRVIARRWNSLHRPRSGLTFCSSSCVETALVLGLIARTSSKSQLPAITH